MTTESQTTDSADLPSLPEPHWPRGYFGSVPSGGYTADQVHAYARAAVAAAFQAPEGGELPPLDDFLPTSGRWTTPIAIKAMQDYARAALAAQAATEAGPMVPLYAIRPIAVEAIRSLNGCSDIEGADGRYLVDELESVAKAAAFASRTVMLNGLTEAETNETASVKGLVGKSAAQPAPVALTEEQIVNDGLMMTPTRDLLGCAAAFEAGVRFAERAHGIPAPQTKEPTNDR